MLIACTQGDLEAFSLDKYAKAFPMISSLINFDDGS